MRIAHAAGVAIATGTDFGGGSTRANQLAWEVEQLVEAGLEPWEALASATWRGGELLGEPDAGVIREGGPGDLVLVHGDPAVGPDRAVAGLARELGGSARPGHEAGWCRGIAPRAADPGRPGTDRRYGRVSERNRAQVARAVRLRGLRQTQGGVDRGRCPAGRP